MVIMNDATTDGPAEPAATFRPERLPLHGERPCLDFANTRVWRLRDRPIETLTTYDDLLQAEVGGGVVGEEVGVVRRSSLRGRRARGCVLGGGRRAGKDGEGEERREQGKANEGRSTTGQSGAHRS